jgi:lipopolysaccharide export system protein LptA
VRLVLGALVALPALPALAGAQSTQRCTWSTPGAQRIVEVAPGIRNIYIGGDSVVMRCPEKGIRVEADSLESYEGEGRLYLIGNVKYSEPRLSVDSDYLTYYQRDERVIANGNVFARLPNGSTLRGPVAEYLRATPSTRAVPRLHATGRPTITLVQRDSLGRPAPPATVVANGVTMIGDSLVYAGGQVIVTREDVLARADSMALDSQREFTVLMRGPSIEGRRERPFTLSGGRIELTGGDRKLRRVLSMGTARAVSEDMTLTSDTIDLRVASDLLQRAIAWGPSRARAFSAAQSITSDSLDVVMPNQRLQEMHAVRGAIAQGKPDSIRFQADTLNWMRGDTIVARFDTTAVANGARTTRLRDLHAVGSAKSYYHLPPADSTMRRPAINYVTGREIVIDFLGTEVSKVTVVEQASGVYLEPSAVASTDTTQARPPANRSTPAAPPRTGTRPATPPVRRP